MRIFYRPHLALIEVRGAQAAVEQIEVRVDGRVFARYGRGVVRRPSVGRLGGKPCDGFAPLPLTVARAASVVDCRVATALGEQVGVVEMDDVAALGRPAAGAEPDASDPWRATFMASFIAVEGGDHGGADALGLMAINWDDIAASLPQVIFVRLLFALVLGRGVSGRSLDHYVGLLDQGARGRDLIRRIVSSAEGQAVDKSHLRNTAVVGQFCREVIARRGFADGTDP